MPQCAHDVNDCQWCPEGVFGFCPEPVLTVNPLLGHCDEAKQCEVVYMSAARTTMNLTASGTWVGDGVCDTACMVESCNFDGGDCSSCAADIDAVRADPDKDVESWCNTECHISMLLNDCCDPACNTECCDNDLGACAGDNPIMCSSRATRFDESRYCAPKCLWEQVADGYCDPACRNEACDFDKPDCIGCVDDEEGDCARVTEESISKLFASEAFCEDGGVATECQASWIGDGFCTPEEAAKCTGGCADPDCAGGANLGDVDADTVLCADGCVPDMVGNGVCDRQCNVDACGLDGGDCEEPECQCSPRQLKNLKCEQACANLLWLWWLLCTLAYC